MIGKISTVVVALCAGVPLLIIGLLSIIRGKPEETLTAVENSPFKILVRSQEFRHSGTVNVEICVAEISSHTFPRGGEQCFFHGFDLDGLSARWRGQREIEISFADGYVTEFRNYASASNRASSLQGFHITMLDEQCDRYPKYSPHGINQLKPCSSTGQTSNQGQVGVP
jgi:hypothetical protein